MKKMSGARPRLFCWGGRHTQKKQLLPTITGNWRCELAMSESEFYGVEHDHKSSVLFEEINFMRFEG